MSSGILEETQDCPVKTTVHALELNLDNSVSVVITKFANKTQFIITETGKTNVLFEVCRVQGKANLSTGKIGHIFETNCLIGLETEEALVTARIIAEQLDISNPIVIGLGFNDISKALNPKNIKDLVDFIKNL